MILYKDCFWHIEACSFLGYVCYVQGVGLQTLSNTQEHTADLVREAESCTSPARIVFRSNKAADMFSCMHFASVFVYVVCRLGT